MKKISLAFLAMALFAVVLHAEDSPLNTLVMHLANGTTQEYPLQASPEISFSGTDMVINTGVTSVVITRNDLAAYDFTYVDYSLVESVITDSNFVRRGNEVFISNVSKGSSVALYSIDGRLLYRSVTNERGEAAVSLGNYGTGIYLLKVNNFTTKIIKR